MKKSQITKRSVSIILTALMAMAVPTQVLAENLPEEEKVYSSFEDVEGNSEEIPNIVTELPDERTETSKVFLLEDGSKMLAEYNLPIHYKNSNDDWVEYNNTLVSDNSSTTDGGSNDYANKNSDISIKLSDKAKTQNMIKLSQNGYSVSWGYENVNKSKIKIVNEKESFSGNEEFTVVENLSSEAIYKNVYNNVDLQYFLTSTGVKENIILNDSDVQNEFDLSYKIQKLTAEQTDDYTITLYNKSNQAVYKIEAPYMTDSNGVLSSQLRLELVSQKGANLEIKLIADYNYIHSDSRSFPIIIDPEITNKLNGELSLNEVYNNTALNHGPYYVSSDHYVTAKINTLPQLGEGERIISAKYNFEINNGDKLFDDTSETPIILNAHKLNYVENNIVSYDSDILDYDSLSYEDHDKFVFDLTKLMQDWYDNGEEIDGFVIEGFDTVSSKTVNIKEASRTSATPSSTIIYKDFSGTENELSYHNFSSGYKSQAKISDYLGNLVVSQQLYEGTGARMPVSISATYNSIKNDEISNCGWNFSFNQRIKESNETLAKAGYDYMYIDKEGTNHYLKKNNDEEKWIDEDGLGITLSVKEDCITVDNGNTIQTYESLANGGKLLSEKDKNGNSVIYSYENGYLLSITDGAGRVIKLGYVGKPDGSKRINQITLPDNEKISILYNSSSIDTISAFIFPDKMASAFYYDKNNKIIQEQLQNRTSGTSLVGKHIFVYNDKGQVTKVTEYGKNNSEGNYLNISYSNDNTTDFEDRNGLKTKYTFNNRGILMSVLNANGYLESNYSSGLANSGGADSFTKNLLTESYEFGTIGVGKYYTKSNGVIDGVQSKDGICEIDSSEPTEDDGNVQYFGSNSIKISNPVNEGNSSFYTSAFHDINMAAENYTEKELTFSAYVKTKDVMWKSLNEAFGALLEVEFYDFFANLIDSKTSIGITETEDWQRISVTATIPENARTMRIKCSVKNTTGTAWFDCLQLEEGNCANDFNALQNSDFANNNYWFTNDNKSISAKDGIVTLGGKAGLYIEPTTEESTTQSTNKDIEESTSVKTIDVAVPDSYIYKYDEYGNVINEFHGTVNKKIKKYYFDEPIEDTTAEQTETTQPTTSSDDSEIVSGNDNSYIYQNVNVDRAYVSFNLVGEAQARSVPLTNNARSFGIVLKVYYEGINVPEVHYQEFNPYTAQKQTVNLTVTPNSMDKIVDYVSFAFVYNNNSNVMTISNAMLNIIGAPIKYKEIKQEENDSTDSTAPVSDLDYDGYFYCEAVSETPNYNKTYTENKKTYDASGNYVTAETNKAGAEVNYSYDINGNITSTIDGEDNVTDFTYNKNNSIASISEENIENKYSYNERGSLVTIEHNDFKYNFSYDNYGKLVDTNVESNALTTNSYLPNNGELQKTAFANGDFVEYTYDNYNQISALKGENGTIAEFIYNKKGKVAKVIDYSAKRTTMYYYDFTSSVTGYYCQTEDGIVLYFVGINKDGDKVEKTNVAGFERTITSGVDNGNAFVESDGISVSGTSDEFKRITSIVTEDAYTKAEFNTNYEYKNISSSNRTTDLVSKLIQKYKNTDIVNYEYSYDNNGNIIEVKQNGTIIAQYGYDELNQISNYADSITGIFARFNYDNSGNITKIYIYRLNKNGLIPSDLISVKTYTYSDTNWKDTLTAYNGTNITYDELGNPLSYRDGMSFTWENGRKLKSVNTGNKTVDMQYDSEGLRTQKKYDDERINYYYDNDKNLTGIDHAGKILFFYYDSKGNVTAMSCYSTKYYYVKNLQGDIVRLVDKTGKTIVTYTYDVLGKVISQTDNSEYNLADINPFRYRGYVYDSETGLYYLKSRYYDPVTGRFLNADMYCDTQSNILGTNMFAYCNNNPVNQIDPEGTDAYWIQFGNAVRLFSLNLLSKSQIKQLVNFFGVINVTTNQISLQFGHTSLLLQDSVNNWWYFYWGPKHVILRPCGKDDFKSYAEVSSYLCGFDPRQQHNYYVYATNSIEKSHYTKCQDAQVTDWLYFGGNFAKSYKYAYELLNKMYYWSNANNLKFTCYENGKRITIFDVCERARDYRSDKNELRDLHSTNLNINREYDLLSYNCVQVSIDVLLEGSFYKQYTKYRNKMEECNEEFIPNSIFKELKELEK